MRVFYRLSNNSFAKPRVADKAACLRNFLAAFGAANITFVADNLTDPDLSSKISPWGEVDRTKLGNSGSFRHALARACAECADDEPVYFVEDDYLHQPGSAELIGEGLGISHYVTLYDCPDKYMNRNDGGPNPLIEHGGEVTVVRRTASTHWKFTNSTTMTFAATGATLRADRDVWDEHCMGIAPRDFAAFCVLVQHRRRGLVSCIPGRATHCEQPWLTPFVDWEAVAAG